MQILAHVLDYRFLYLEHIRWLVFPDRGEKTASIRLRKLWQNGYVDRLFIPFVLRTDRGASIKRPGQPIYALDENGAKVLAKFTGLPRTHVPWKPKMNGIVTGLLEHWLTVSAFRAALTAAVREIPNCNVTFWLNEQTLRQEVTKYRIHNDLPASVSRTVVPDGLFGLQMPNGKIECFFLEIDMATEESRRIREKLSRYVTAYDSDLFMRVLKIPSFRVLFVTTGVKRMSNIMRIVRSFARCQNMFWFSVAEEMTAEKTKIDNLTPERILTPIWRKAAVNTSWSLLN